MNEEELKKGCGKEFYTHDRIILVKCGTECKHDKRKSNQIHLCPTCQARLEGFQKGKLEQKKEDKNKQDEFYNEFDLASNCSKDDKLFKKLWNKYFKQLQKEVKEEKQDE